jgi:hypothetical protein
MPRFYKIRWRDKDKIELNKAIKNFNSKLNRLYKKGLDINLPDKIKLKEIKERIYSRKDFTIELNRLKNFTKKGAELPANIGNEKITKWEYNEVKKAIRRDNIRKKKEEEEKRSEVYENGNIIGRRIGIELLEYKPRSTDIRNKSYQEFKKLQQLFFNRNDKYSYERKKGYLENYIKSLNDYKFMKEYNEVIKKLEEMNLDNFIKLIDNGTLPEINEYYYIENMYHTWNQLLSALGIDSNYDYDELYL